MTMIENIQGSISPQSIFKAVESIGLAQQVCSVFEKQRIKKLSFLSTNNKELPKLVENFRHINNVMFF